MTDSLKRQIREAFAEVKYPGDWCLRGSNEGDEPYLLESEFKGKTDWHTLDHKFIDRAPDGYGSALSFFSDEAFRFYLPAYLVADIDGHLKQSDPVFHLCYGLDDRSKSKPVNPLRYGNRTWLDEATHKFAMFSETQCAAIVAYLRFKRDNAMDFEADTINQAIDNYWDARAQGKGHPT